jgi:hypothetical protein
MVGAAGFEPATPRPPVWCANQAALRPEPTTVVEVSLPERSHIQPSKARAT